MLLTDFDFELPENLIAQEPLAEREASRLLVYDHMQERVVAHSQMRKLSEYLPKQSLLVFNNTRVIPARLFGSKPSGGKVELLLVQPHSADGPEQTWSALLKNAGSLGLGTMLRIADDLSVTLLDTIDRRAQSGPPLRRIQLSASHGTVLAAIHRYGQLPLPPYMKRPPREEDRERYQTVFARHAGSAAAPTAGLHFGDTLLASLQHDGHTLAFVTLHVGAGTFLPVRDNDVSKHVMHAEPYEISEETAQKIRTARAEGRCVVAVGTTVVRTLESAVNAEGVLQAGTGESRLFIRPGFRFQVIDALVTNFHLPRSTLLMLVCALGGHAGVLKAYEEAVREQYRFFSYGDAMLLYAREYT